MSEPDQRLLKALRDLDAERTERRRLEKRVAQLSTRLANAKRTAAPKAEQRAT